MQDELLAHLQFLYGEERAAEICERLERIVTRRKVGIDARGAGKTEMFSQRDAILITYGDMVRADGERPLQTLHEFLSAAVGDSVNTVHLLPFFPYSSDDGFSVIDYRQVDPALGNWSDIAVLEGTYLLMFDAVVNHVSAQSDWFKRFLQGEPPYDEYFIVVDGDAGLEDVFRPRALPLLSEVETANGRKSVWTTFSADQIDLNFANPDVLLAVIDTLLFYVEKGADLIRLDAIAYIWKEMGSPCIHLPQTHRIIQLMRSVLDIAAPHVLLITETNVPHEDNVSYFGDGYNEAQMVYNFSLPPLTLHAFHKGNAETLSAWAKTLELPSQQTSFFNFLASHDGIGLTPARGLISDEEVREIAERVEALGGYVSYRSNPDGSQSPYELNISYIDALGDPDKEEPDATVARRFMAAQAIMLALRGVPGIYFHSLFGSRSWHEGVEQSGQKRRINRQKLSKGVLQAELANENSLRHLILPSYLRLLQARRSEPAFHPNGGQNIVDLDRAVFAIERVSPDGRSSILCLQNVSSEERQIRLPLGFATAEDILSGQAMRSPQLTLQPYQIFWLRQVEDGEMIDDELP
ncbi:MAG: alpha-amylase family glycosyl hydrolase [Candidatus Promineifilaceae bacterium]